MAVPIPAPEVVAFCDRLKKLIERLGPKAFGLPELVVLYSGPSRDLEIDAINNIERSSRESERLGAARIDDTHIGQLLIRVHLYAYFEKIYGEDKERIEAAVFEVWAFASREFVKSGFRHASTAVCGADPARVFYAHELKVLLTEDTSVETINGVALRHFKDIYAAHGGGNKGFYAAYVEICRAELAVAHQRARTEDTPEAWEDYTARQRFFDVEQVATKAKTALTVMAATNVAVAALDPPKVPVPPVIRSQGMSASCH